MTQNVENSDRHADLIQDARETLVALWSGDEITDEKKAEVITLLIEALETETALNTVGTENAKFFYTTATPHRWSSGPTTVPFNDENGYIESLVEARTLAKKHAHESYGEDRVITTYGVSFPNK
jgi:hypothetical protein